MIDRGAVLPRVVLPTGPSRPAVAVRAAWSPRPLPADSRVARSLLYRLLLCGAGMAVMALSSIVLTARADDGERCSDAALDAARTLAGPDAVAEPVDAHCRRWPYAPSIELVAAAFARGGADAQSDAGGRALTGVLAMLDGDTAGVLASHVMPLDEDALLAVGEGSLRLDTARYDLAPGVRAIGLVVESRAPGPSCPDGRFNRELTLFVREGARLRPVLGTWLEQWQIVEGNPCAWSAQAYADQTAKLSIGVESSQHAGFNDLALMADVERYAKTVDGVESTSRYRKRRVLRYDGASYTPDPWQLMFFWAEAP